MTNKRMASDAPLGATATELHGETRDREGLVLLMFESSYKQISTASYEQIIDSFIDA